MLLSGQVQENAAGSGKHSSASTCHLVISKQANPDREQASNGSIDILIEPWTKITYSDERCLFFLHVMVLKHAPWCWDWEQSKSNNRVEILAMLIFMLGDVKQLLSFLFFKAMLLLFSISKLLSLVFSLHFYVSEAFMCPFHFHFPFFPFYVNCYVLACSVSLKIHYSKPSNF